jgi:hypothetical protein
VGHTSTGGYGAKIGKSGQWIFTSLNRQTIHAGRGQLRLEYIRCELPSVSLLNRLAGPERLMDDIVWRGGIVQRVSRLVLTSHMSQAHLA